MRRPRHRVRSPKELAEAYFHEELSPAERERLTSSLREDAGLVRRFAEVARDEIMLFELHRAAEGAFDRASQGVETPCWATRRQGRRRSGLVLWAATVAACVLVGLVGFRLGGAAARERRGEAFPVPWAGRSSPSVPSGSQVSRCDSCSDGGRT